MKKLKTVFTTAFMLLVMSVNGQTEEGSATWYGKAYHNRKTASGKVFNMEGMTCAADPKYKFGTKLEITNLENGKSVIVTVTDRGTAIKGNKIDLSVGAFRQIANPKKGKIKISIKKLA